MNQSPNYYPKSRQTLYYIGLTFIFCGVLFGLAGVKEINDANKANSEFFQKNTPIFPPYNMLDHQNTPPEDHSVTFFIIGFIFIAGGFALTALGRSGLAGSGLILDTAQEREDRRPQNYLIGEQINDVLEKVNIEKLFPQASETIIKIRCTSCSHLNDENDKFCGGCGTSLINELK
ncbi:MAG: zinc ribbon domain-containing protein [Saprospiraceae bacterium]|nr:zinc ribbon domain-containing protein [Saprospiraceae bacterium]